LEEEILNSDISKYENGKDLNQIFLGELSKLNLITDGGNTYSNS
jgi:hypothetical protein